MKIIVTNKKEISNEYDYNELVKDSVIFKYGDTTQSYTVGRGEPEDMIFGRDLEECCSIIKMITLAHTAGKLGHEIEFKYETEEL